MVTQIDRIKIIIKILRVSFYLFLIVGPFGGPIYLGVIKISIFKNEIVLGVTFLMLFCIWIGMGNVIEIVIYNILHYGILKDLNSNESYEKVLNLYKEEEYVNSYDTVVDSNGELYLKIKIDPPEILWKHNGYYSHLLRKNEITGNWKYSNKN